MRSILVLSGSYENFLILLLCFLILFFFYPTTKNTLFKNGCSLDCHLTICLTKGKKSADSTSDSVIEVGNMFISSPCS